MTGKDLKKGEKGNLLEKNLLIDSNCSDLIQQGDNHITFFYQISLIFQ